MKKPLLLCSLIALFAAPSFTATAAPAAAPASANVLTGKVAETMNAATYTYVLVDTGAKKAWAAAPQFAVKVGDTVTIADAMPMTNYQSKTLNRTFDVVYFSGNVQVNGKSAAATPAPLRPRLPPVPISPASPAPTAARPSPRFSPAKPNSPARPSPSAPAS